MSTHSDVIAAVQSGDVEKLRGLLHDDPSLAAAKDANGVSALMFAFYYRRSEIADLLLAEKSDLDIFEATAAGRPDKVSEILQREPQIAKSWSPDGFTALHFAAFFNRPEIAGILIRNGADVSAASHNAMKVTPLHSAAAAHSGTVVRILVENGAPPNARQEGGWTALHEAAQIGDIKMVKTLLEHGAIHRQQATAGKRLRTWRRPKGTRRL